MGEDIRKVVPEVDDVDSFKTWVHITNDELILSTLINNIDRDDPQPCDYDPEWDGE